ncbi:tRNA (adenosine(37)-N6)-dimethylallyltransferase MiaA [Butyrivibrio sp. INlla16]|uniref:tRNA (adenosine(37)-N6)-dimethylallyltransferase MiaA n=1 Tax=Butyrivibrio sp. INlla16 TaxID=1520807 RepID=UPI000891C81F|nr:tRNA (adenosine(37)-N6)-dimethylallyltransferase MiaA [Butyrivibrio sp. INlla16]SDB30595.1 tRNA dimethylallyltransferase [Butyrivibrio sp. INlla16]
MKRLVILTGPTAVGKTKISLELAKQLGGEIISADSMQVYKDMNIGTDKISKEAMQGIPHHLIDFLDPAEDFNVFEFQKLAKEAIEDITNRGKLPIIVGGTGFYIQSVLYDIDFSDNHESDELKAFKQELSQLAGTPEGVHKLYEMLKETDPEYAKDLHENNVKRVMRALCFNKETGMKISEHNEDQRAKSSPYDFFYFVLTDDREILYDRIEKRIDKMMEEGLIDEVRALKERNIDRKATSMQALGYREILSYLDNEVIKERAVELLKRNTRHFAKRQLTWFRREKDVTWVDKSEFRRDDMEIASELVRRIKERWNK